MLSTILYRVTRQERYFMDKKRVAVKTVTSLVVSIAMIVLQGCSRAPEMTLEEIAAYTHRSGSLLLEKTVNHPWQGGPYVSGKTGGSWYDTILADPKTFNHYIAERDAESATIIGVTTDLLSEYDPWLKVWKPDCAFAQIETDEKKGTLTVHFTLRDALFWTYYGSDRKIPVTSDDALFWYNEIAGDPSFQSSGYEQQFVTMADGSQKHIDMVKIDDKRFDFVFPRIVADPMLATNMTLIPSFIYRPAKEKDGVDGVKKLFSVAVDPKTIPSIGRWYIVSYEPGQRLVFKRNPYYREVDDNGVSIPYPDEKIIQIVGDQNTDYLLFKQGKQETYVPRPEEVDAVVNGQGSSYTVFRRSGAMAAPFWTFNQNAKNKEKPYYTWFTKKEFRQAMSCLLNRERIITQTYRGLADTKYTFFPDANSYYNPAIQLAYRYDPARALELLASIGIKRSSDGILRDAAGNQVMFDLTIAAASSTANDIAQIIADECSRVGITVTVRQIDFQKMIEQMTATYDWQSLIIAFGPAIFPSQGSNVWPSSGNLHVWYPEQKKTATEWESRIDYLYNEGCYTNDHEAAAKIWNEYQSILLEQCPLIYLVRPRSFFAIRNIWDLRNVYFDTINDTMIDHVFLKQE
jgi:peptide/nickel transport system substrate-binding protein